MNCELSDAEIWLKSALQEDEVESASLRQPVEKCYCLSVARVSYGREAMVAGVSGDTPIHRLVVHDLRGAWTKTNRDVAFALFDSFIKTQQLKKNLSTAALKGFHRDNSSTPNPHKNRATRPTVVDQQGTSTQVVTPSSSVKPQQGEAAGMLQQLIAEAANKPVAFSDDLSVQTRGQQLRGLAACHQDDVLHKNWLSVYPHSTERLLQHCRNIAKLLQRCCNIAATLKCSLSEKVQCSCNITVSLH